MNELQLPKQFEETPWEHALIMTYGLDLPFFEKSILRLLPRCRNRMLLMDGEHFLNLCTRYAENNEQPHFLNQVYVAAGIFAPRDAHAKLILLTNPDQGHLLVGSGNTGWQGYASGGELFTLYKFQKDSPDTLSAFIAVYDLVESLIQRQYIKGLMERHIKHMWERTPWLFQHPKGTKQPVRHNLTDGFLSQLIEVVGEETVEELWILTPFYDKEVLALSHLIEKLCPQRTILLLQARQTSVDIIKLQKVLETSTSQCEIRSVQKKGENTYIHAKCYLLKLANRAICLQGSPNLSQVAILLADPQGNIEVANLLVGQRDAFDYLLDGLEISEKVTDLSSLQLTYNEPEVSNETLKQSWQLIGGEWEKNLLCLYIRGTVPSLQSARLEVGNRVFPLQVRHLDTHRLDLILPSSADNLLTSPTPISIQWLDGETIHTTNSIFVCNIGALDILLRQEKEAGSLHYSGDLNLEDKEFEELLAALRDTLLIDQQSIWELAGHTKPSHQKSEEAGHQIDYPTIDYEALRQHPKIRQYLQHTENSHGYMRSRLQIILNSIQAHLKTIFSKQGLIPTDSALQTLPAITDYEEVPITEADQEEVQISLTRHWSIQQKISRELKKLIERYLQGMSSTAFQQAVPHELLIKNYIIFSQMLWRLYAKDWLDHQYVSESLLTSWKFFWGDDKQLGYFYQLSDDQQLEIWQELRTYRNDALTLAAFYYSAHLAASNRWEEHLFSLRNGWRIFLQLNPLPLTEEVITDAQSLLKTMLPYDPPRPMGIIEQLAKLAHFETRARFLHRLESSGRFPIDSCSFRKEKTTRGVIDCLIIQSPEALATKETAVALLQEWMLAEYREYYHLMAVKKENPVMSTHVIIYDMKTHKGNYGVRAENGKMVSQKIADIQAPVQTWDATLAQLRDLVIHVERKQHM